MTFRPLQTVVGPAAPPAIAGIHQECPVCFGKGEVEIQESQLGPSICVLCWGIGWVDPTQICECGRPAVIVSPELHLHYCGRNNCLMAKKFRLQGNMGMGA